MPSSPVVVFPPLPEYSFRAGNSQYATLGFDNTPPRGVSLPASWKCFDTYQEGLCALPPFRRRPFAHWIQTSSVVFQDMCFFLKVAKHDHLINFSYFWVFKPMLSPLPNQDKEMTVCLAYSFPCRKTLKMQHSRGSITPRSVFTCISEVFLHYFTFLRNAFCKDDQTTRVLGVYHYKHFFLNLRYP